MVYLVDDDVDDLEFVREAFIEHSYKGPVNTASNGQSLMDLLSNQNIQSKPSVIVLDLNMPLKDGFETLRDIKENPALRSIPVVILTASSSKRDEIRCLELGCNYYFTKPARIEEYHPFVSMIKRLMNKAA